jgi:hypothetical protein
MSDHIQKTLDQALEELRKHESAAHGTKVFINQLCVFGQREPMFPDLGDAASTRAGSGRVTIKRNAYYGKPLASCVRDYLEARKSAGIDEASLDEIMSALKEGSYDLETISKDEDGQKRGVAISLAKNTSTFHRLPNDDFGLTVWYPAIKAKKEKASGAQEPKSPEAEISPEETPKPEETNPETQV